MKLDYKIIYSSSRKTLTITVERDRSIVVRAPTGTHPDKIQQIVESRKQWLYEKIHHEQKYRVPLHPPGKELVNGESLLYLGRYYRLELVDDQTEIKFINNLYAKKLGVRFNQAKITDSKYRWGSCTPQDNVNFNWRLIKAPMFVIDYVVVHELAHLIESNHTPRFWHIIKSQIATMEKAKQWLKEHGQMLEQSL